MNLYDNVFKKLIQSAFDSIGFLGILLVFDILSFHIHHFLVLPSFYFMNHLKLYTFPMEMILLKLYSD